MRSAEAELRLQINVSASELSINALVETPDRLEGEFFASLLDVLQHRHREALRAGEAPSIRCPRYGGRRWVKRGSRPRQLARGSHDATTPMTTTESGTTRSRTTSPTRRR